MRIPITAIEKAQEKYISGESLVEAEEAILGETQQRYRQIKDELDDLNFMDSDQRVKYGLVYNDLVSLIVPLSNLVALKEDPEKNRAIEELTGRIKEHIKAYEPVDRTNQIIRYLNDQLKQKDSEIRALGASRDAIETVKAELMREIRSQGSGTSTAAAYIAGGNYFFTAGVPALVRSESGIYISRDFVKNKDIATFLAAQGEERVLEFTQSPPDNPAVNISFRDAARFCNWLSDSFGLDACYVFTGDGIHFQNNNGYRFPNIREIETAYKASLLNTRDLIEWDNNGTGRQAHAVRWQNNQMIPPANTIRLDDIHPGIGFRIARNFK
jgi:hypothetical protein